jgi:hypothetical protein
MTENPQFVHEWFRNMKADIWEGINLTFTQMEKDMSPVINSLITLKLNFKIYHWFGLSSESFIPFWGNFHHTLTPFHYFQTPERRTHGVSYRTCDCTSWSGKLDLEGWKYAKCDLEGKPLLNFLPRLIS